MESDLKNLIDKIKKDGVEQAEQDAAKIITNAKEKAAVIIDNAKATAQTIIDEAKQESARFRQSSEQALKQSARDALLTLRSRVTEFFGRVVKNKVQEELASASLKEIILQAVEHSIKDGMHEIEVVVSEKDKQLLQKTLFASLRKEAKDKVLLKDNKNINKGFRIGEQGKDSYLDFTDQAISDGFKRYLNPKLTDALDIDLGLKQDENNGK